MILHHHFVKKLVVISLTITILLYVTSIDHMISKMYYFINPTKSIKCYHTKNPSLPDISNSFDSEMKENSIFFHETSCNSYFKKKLFIHSRQACAVESAAKLHPNRNVYLLFTSPGVFKNDGSESDRILQALMSYDNIKLRHLDFEKYANGTPVEDLYNKEEIQGSRYAQSHSSDVLRYLTLWKYGGVYLDLDVIVVKPLDELTTNYAGSESDENVAAGVLSFSATGEGHRLVTRCLDDLRMNFKGNEWGYNGPGVITRLLRRICNKEHAKSMISQNCNGFKVYPSNYFYPIRWQDWLMYFDENYSETVLKLSQTSYLIHVWNKHSVDTKISIHSKAAYVILAQKYCPKVISECRVFF